MARANLRSLLGRDGLKVSHSIFEFDSPGMGQIMQVANLDFVFIDMEHSGFGYAELKRLVSSCRVADLPSLVRPPSKNSHHIARALDVGADGLMLPMVGTAEQAEEAVADMKYPPTGRRGVALGIAHDDYKPGPAAAKLRAANRRTALATLIETAEGIENVDAIAAVRGVDCLWIGHFDLSSSLGIPGEFDNPLFTKSVNRVRRAAKKHGKALGRLIGSPGEAKALYKQGFDVICYSGDLWVYQQALVDGVEEIRKNCAGRKWSRK